MLIKSLDRRSFLKLAAMTGIGLGTPLAEFLEFRMASAQAKPLNAAYSNNSLAHSWCAQGKDAVEYYAKFLNVNVDWQDPAGGDPAAQRAIFDTFAANASNYDFVGVQPDSTGTLVEPITTLIEAGKPVIAIDTLIAPLSQQQQMGVLTFMSCDNVLLAESTATVLANLIGGKGKVARISGDPGHTGSQGRGVGFHNIFDPLVASGDVTIVEDQTANWDTAKAADLTQTFLNKYPDLNAIFYDNDDMGLSGMKVVQDAGAKVYLSGFDAMQPAIQAVLAGTYAATARNSANRVHSLSVLIGAWAATVGLDMAKNGLPQWFMIDGPAVTPPPPADPSKADTPWLVKGLGIGAASGQLWLENNLHEF